MGLLFEIGISRLNKSCVQFYLEQQAQPFLMYNVERPIQYVLGALQVYTPHRKIMRFALHCGIFDRSIEFVTPT